MNEQKLMIRVLATLRTDLAVQEFALCGCIRDVEDDGNLVVLEHLNRAVLDLASAREYLDDVVDMLNTSEENVVTGRSMVNALFGK